MIEELKQQAEEAILLAFCIFTDTLIVIFALVCFYLIEYITHILGFENQMVSSLLHQWAHPAVLLSLVAISIINILYRFVPRNNSDSRFEIVQMNEDNEN